MMAAIAGTTISRKARRYCLNTPTSFAERARVFSTGRGGTTLSAGAAGRTAGSGSSVLGAGSAIALLLGVGVLGALDDCAPDVFLDAGELPGHRFDGFAIDALEHARHHVGRELVETVEQRARGSAEGQALGPAAAVR